MLRLDLQVRFEEHQQVALELQVVLPDLCFRASTNTTDSRNLTRP